MKERSFASLPVFLVDDEESVLRASAAVLQSAGVANIRTVSDSRELLPALERQPASAIVLDLFMPHVTGNKLLPDIVHLYPEVPVIVMTAALDIETAIRSMKEGAFDYLIKPVSRQALLSALERLAPAGASVLIADDEADAVQLYRRTLISAARGYRVLTASDGARALKVLREHHPDVLLVDLMMPEMSGFQLLANKISDPALAAIPTVIVSARDPVGSTIVTNGLAVTRLGGLSGADLLATIRALSRLLGLRRSDAPTERATPAG